MAVYGTLIQNFVDESINMNTIIETIDLEQDILNESIVSNIGESIIKFIKKISEVIKKILKSLTSKLFEDERKKFIDRCKDLQSKIDDLKRENRYNEEDLKDAKKENQELERILKSIDSIIMKNDEIFFVPTDYIDENKLKALIDIKGSDLRSAVSNLQTLSNFFDENDGNSVEKALHNITSWINDDAKVFYDIVPERFLDGKNLVRDIKSMIKNEVINSKEKNTFRFFGDSGYSSLTKSVEGRFETIWNFSRNIERALDNLNGILNKNLTKVSEELAIFGTKYYRNYNRSEGYKVYHNTMINLSSTISILSTVVQYLGVLSGYCIQATTSLNIAIHYLISTFGRHW